MVATPEPTAAQAPIDVDTLAQSVADKLANSDVLLNRLDHHVNPSSPISLGPFHFSEQDAWLLQLCPLVAVVGMIIGCFVRREWPKGGWTVWTASAIRGLLLASVIGLAVAAFFIGAVNKEQFTLVRVLLATLLLGAQADAVWDALCKLVLAIFSRSAQQIG